jgi:hypothetical protein
MLFLIPEDGHGSYDIFINYIQAIGDRISTHVLYSQVIPIGRLCTHIVCTNGYLYEEAKAQFPYAKFFFLNTEQMTIPLHKQRVIQFHIKFPNVIHIDYSQSNIGLLRKDCSTVQYIWIPQLPPVSLCKSSSQHKPVSVVFLGCISSYRFQRLHELSNELHMNLDTYSNEYIPNTIFVHNRLYNRIRDTLLKNTHVVLNIPIDEKHTIFPSLRIHWALYQGAHVVTVPHLDEPQWESPSLRSGIHTVQWGPTFFDKVQEVLTLPPPSLTEEDHTFFHDRIQDLLKLC